MIVTSSILMLNNCLFMFNSNPLVISIILLTQAMTISLMLILFMKMSWTSYALIIIFMSAVMMIFLYFSSISSNIYFSPKFKEIFLMMTLLTLSFLMINFFLENFLVTKTMTPLLQSLKKIYSNKFSLVTMMIMLLLFISLIVVSSNTRNCKKPLRAI